MKAIVQDRYGPPDEVLRLEDIDEPVPGEGEVLVRVRASTAAGDDWHIVRGLPYVGRLEFGLRRPKRRIPGQDVAGLVEAVGPGVRELATGDEVFGWCAGAFAEYVAVPAGALAPTPSNLTLEEAAAVPICGFTALQGLRDRGEIRAGQRVLVVGAAGGVGTFAVQIAKAFDAEVTGVCSERSAELVRSLGADRIVDYAREDFAADGPRYDLILDMIGNRTLADCRRALTPRGTLVMVGGRGGPWFMGTDRWLRALLISPFVRQRLRPLIHKDDRDDLLALKDLVEAGKVRPVVDRRYPLAEAVEAIRYLEERHARGKVVITIGE